MSLSSTFKRAASLVGDLAFHARRRELAQVYAAHNVPFYGYLFSEPQPQNPPEYGGMLFIPILRNTIVYHRGSSR